MNRRSRTFALLARIKKVNIAKKEHERRFLPASVPRLDAAPVRLEKPAKMPHLRRACDEDDDA